MNTKSKSYIEGLLKERTNRFREVARKQPSKGSYSLDARYRQAIEINTKAYMQQQALRGKPVSEEVARKWAITVAEHHNKRFVK